MSVKIPSSIPSMVKSALMKMPVEKQEIFIEEYQRRTKSVGLAYVLWLCLGFHYLYLGKWGTQFIFWFTAGGFFIWYFIDLFRIPGVVSEYNKTIAIEVMSEFKTIMSDD